MATNTTDNPTPQDNLQTGGSSGTDFLKAIQEKLLGQSGVISSTNSDLQTKLESAIQGVQTGADKSNQKIESEYGRERSYMEGTANESFLAGRAAGSGGVLNMAALRSLTETTDKSLKDLEQRKQELILTNDAAAATKISELQIKSLEFRQNAQQQVFSNLLGIANLGVQSAAEQRLAQQQTFTEKQAVSNIALQYGLKVLPGDTLDSVTSRAMVFASDEQKARLANLQSQTRKNNAEAAKALKGDAGGVTVGSLPTLVNQAILFEKAGKDINDPEYANLLGTITKAGQLDAFYKEKQKTQLAVDAAQKEAFEQKQNAASSPKSGGYEFNKKSGKIEQTVIDPFTGKKSFAPAKSDFQIDFSKLGKVKTKLTL